MLFLSASEGKVAAVRGYCFNRLLDAYDASINRLKHHVSCFESAPAGSAAALGGACGDLITLSAIFAPSACSGTAVIRRFLLALAGSPVASARLSPGWGLAAAARVGELATAATAAASCATAAQSAGPVSSPRREVGRVVASPPLRASRESQAARGGGAKGVQRGCEGGAKGVRRACEGGAKGVQRGCEGGAKGVRRACEGGAKGVRKGCEGRAKGVQKTPLRGSEGGLKGAPKGPLRGLEHLPAAPPAWSAWA
eukprot:50915-Prorocentrum_minimum.AAC.1